MTYTSDELFDLYYKMGVNRSLQAVADATKKDFMEIVALAELKGWEQRADAKDADLERVKNRKHRQRITHIRDQLTYEISKLIKRMNSNSLGLPFEIRSASDLQQVAQSYRLLNEASRVAMNTAVDSEVKDRNPKTWSDLLDQSMESSGGFDE